MMRWSRFAVIVVVCVMIFMGIPLNVRAQMADNWGFESGTLAGWSIVSAATHVGVTGADAFATPYWGSYMAVLGTPGLPFDDVGAKKLAMPFSSLPVPTPRRSQELQPLGHTLIGYDTIRRTFTANMTHLVFAYNVFSYHEEYFGSFSYSVSLADGSGVIASSPTTARNVGTGNRTMFDPPPVLESTGWQIVDVDLSQYLGRQLVIEVSVGDTTELGGPEKGTLVFTHFHNWAYFDVNPDMPIVSNDVLPPTITLPKFDSFAGVSGWSDGAVQSFYVRTSPFQLQFTLEDNNGFAKWTIKDNGVVIVDPMGMGLITYALPLTEGRNDVEISATDTAGNYTSQKLVIYLDSMAPALSINTLPPSVSAPTLSITGSATDAVSGLASLSINGKPAIPFLDGSFSEKLTLVNGINTILIEVTDKAGNTASQTFTVMYGGTPTFSSSIYVVLTIGSTDMEVNGLTQKLDAAPFIKDGRTLLPIRALIEALGGSVEWNTISKTATVMLGSRTVALTIGSTTALVNGKPITLDVAPMIIKGRTFLPLRAVAESLGLDLAWEPVSQTISLTYWP